MIDTKFPLRGKALWLPLILSIVPIAIYILIFNKISLNVNYLAFDDILILGVIPDFWESPIAEKWKRLTELFPEHRLVFSRSVILFLQGTFGRLNLIWAMVIANICWAGCAVIFYKAFQRLKISFWYFVPIIWLWFNIQSFENIFWGVSSLCNFGVLFFSLLAFYFASFHPNKLGYALLFALIATFTYGNGLMSFPIIGGVCLLSGQRKGFFFTLVAAAIVAGIYFIDFTPITQNLNFRNPEEVKSGIMGFFGFLGSIVTIAAYTGNPTYLTIAIGFGVLIIATLLFLFRNQWKDIWVALLKNKPYSNQVAIFSISLVVFIVITAAALTYKRISMDHFEGMFKGRYRMYSTLLCIAVYFAFLSLTRSNIIRKALPVILVSSIILNLAILQRNFLDAVNNRRDAIAQEFNARYNVDWNGTRMFSMTQEYIEKIRAYYSSDDPLATGWQPQLLTQSIHCDSTFQPDVFSVQGEFITVQYNNDHFPIQKDYSDAGYLILKSNEHVYASALHLTPIALKTTIRRGKYASHFAQGAFHRGNIEPGKYELYLLIRKNGVNKMYCTRKVWEEN